MTTYHLIPSICFIVYWSNNTPVGNCVMTTYHSSHLFRVSRPNTALLWYIRLSTLLDMASYDFYCSSSWKFNEHTFSLTSWLQQLMMSAGEKNTSYEDIPSDVQVGYFWDKSSCINWNGCIIIITAIALFGFCLFSIYIDRLMPIITSAITCKYRTNTV